MSEVELPQSAAVMALERNDLDMDKAVRDVYRQKMNSNALYGYIWGELEGGGIRKKQHDRVMQMIKENKYSNNVSIVLYVIKYLVAYEYYLHMITHCTIIVSRCQTTVFCLSLWW